MGTQRCIVVQTVDPDDLDALWSQPKSSAALHHASSAAASRKGDVRSPAGSHDGGGSPHFTAERPSSAGRVGSAASEASDAEGSAAERTASGSSAGVHPLRAACLTQGYTVVHFRSGLSVNHKSPSCTQASWRHLMMSPWSMAGVAPQTRCRLLASSRLSPATATAADMGLRQAVTGPVL